MSLKENFEMMAKYNKWMNENIFNIATGLNENQYNEPMGAFFGSINGTLNHILVADLAWLNRFKSHPSQFSALTPLPELPIPSALDQILYPQIKDLREARRKTDNIISSLCNEANDSDYDVTLSYKNSKGYRLSKRFGYLVQHLFNHQTHHRGQVTTLLNQLGVDFGVTDLVAIVSDEL